MTTEQMYFLLSELKNKIPNTKITPPEQWTYDHVVNYIEYTCLNDIMRERVKKEFIKRHGLENE